MKVQTTMGRKEFVVSEVKRLSRALVAAEEIDLWREVQAVEESKEFHNALAVFEALLSRNALQNKDEV